MNSPAVLTALAAAATLVPLALGAAALTPRLARLVNMAGPWAPVPALVLAAVSTGPWVAAVPWPPVGLRVGVDLIGWVFLVLAALTWLFAGMSARDRSASFFFSMTGSIGMTLARDAATFFACGALMSLSAYGLVIGTGSEDARRAGRQYLTFALSGDVLLLAGLILSVLTAGTISLDDLPAGMVLSRVVLPATTLILVACGIKAGAVPLHRWLPVSCAAVSAPEAAVLSGALGAGGVLAAIRLLSIGQVSLPMWGVPVALLGVIATLYGVAMGLRENDARSVLAWSSVCETGFMAAAIGMGLVVASSWPVLLAAILVYVLHHGLTKGAMFLSVGVRQAGLGGRAGGAAALAATVCLGLSLAGAPLTSGAAAKLALTSAITGTGMSSSRGIVAMLALGAAGATLLLARLVWVLTLPGDPGVPRGMAAGTAVPVTPGSALGTRVTLAWVAAVAVAVLLPWTLLARLTDPSTAWSTANVAYIAPAAVAGLAAGWARRRGYGRAT